MMKQKSGKSRANVETFAGQVNATSALDGKMTSTCKLLGKAPKGVKLKKPPPRRKAVDEEMKNVMNIVKGLDTSTTQGPLISETLLNEGHEKFESNASVCEVLNDLEDLSRINSIIPDDNRVAHFIQSVRKECEDGNTVNSNDVNANPGARNMRAPRRFKLQKPRPLKMSNNIATHGYPIAEAEADISQFIECLKMNDITYEKVSHIKTVIQKHGGQLKASCSGILQSCHNYIEEAIKRCQRGSPSYSMLHEVLMTLRKSRILPLNSTESQEKEACRRYLDRLDPDCQKENDCNGNLEIPNTEVIPSIQRLQSKMTQKTLQDENVEDTTYLMIQSTFSQNKNKSSDFSQNKFNNFARNAESSEVVSSASGVNMVNGQDTSDKSNNLSCWENNKKSKNSTDNKQQQSYDCGGGELDDIVLWDTEDDLQYDINENISTSDKECVSEDISIAPNIFETVAGLQIIGTNDHYVKEAVEILKKHFLEKKKQNKGLENGKMCIGHKSSKNDNIDHKSMPEQKAIITNRPLDKSERGWPCDSGNDTPRNLPEKFEWTCKTSLNNDESLKQGQSNLSDKLSNSVGRETECPEDINIPKDPSLWLRWRSRSHSNSSKECSDVELPRENVDKSKFKDRHLNHVDQKWGSDDKFKGAPTGPQTWNCSSPLMKSPSFLLQSNSKMQCKVSREPLGPGSNKDIIKSAEENLPNGVYTATWRRNMFLRYNTAVNIFDTDSDDLCSMEPVSYDRVALLDLSTAPLSRKMPTEFSYLSKIFPEVCLTQVSEYFCPAQENVHWNPKFFRSLSSDARQMC